MNNNKQIFCLVVRNGKYLVNDDGYFLSGKEFYDKYPNFSFDDLILISRQCEEYSTSYDCGYLTDSTASFYVSKNTSLVIENIIEIMDAFSDGAAADSVTGMGDGFEGVHMNDIEDAIGAKIPDEKKEIWKQNVIRRNNSQIIPLVIFLFLLALAGIGMYILYSSLWNGCGCY